MQGKRSILFYGELPPNAIHGISCSSRINLNLLGESFEVVTIEEKSTLQSARYFKKFDGRLREHFSIIVKAISRKFNFFYIVFSISSIGSLKTLFSILCFRLFNRGNVVLHIHRGDFMKWYNAHLVNRFLATLVINLSAKIIVLSDLQKRDLMKLFKVPVFVLHNTVEYESDAPLRKKGKTRFIYISNYLEEKGIFELLIAFTRLQLKYKDITLHTYGAFPSAEIKQKVISYVSSGIIINEVITGLEKFDEIGKADCLILPSYNEGEPVVLLEAMSTGTPVISTNVGLIPEMLGSDYPFISIPRNAASLEEKITQFIDYPRINELSQALKERYLLNYSNKSHASELESVFN